MRALLLAALLVALGACGPSPGPTGAPSTDGADGADGSDGSDGGGDGTDGSAPVGTQPLLPQPALAEDLDPADDVLHVALTPAPHSHELEDWRTGEVWTVDGYAYNDQLPGPTLRAKVGDTVVVELTNGLDDPTTIHWHGVNVPYAMDGVMWTTSPVMPGESFTYTFVVEDVGTFWYHPHFDTEHQVDLGLYGALIVEDPAQPAVDHDLLLVVDDWTEVEVTDHPPDVVHGAHGEVGRWAINGAVQPRLEVAGGEIVRARVFNVSNHGYLDLEAEGLRWIAGGQGLRGAVTTPASVLVAPGDRAELELLPGEADLALLDRPYSLNGGAGLGDPEPLLDVVVNPAAAAAPTDWPVTPLSPTEDPGHTDVLYVFQGEAHTDTWRINGERFPDVTVEQLSLGQDAVIEVRNLSATEHPFHLHGLHLEVLSRDGVAPALREVVDTINVPMHTAVRLRVVADNPGFWMAHCHILPHADGGMMTVLEVAE